MIALLEKKSFLATNNLETYFSRIKLVDFDFIEILESFLLIVILQTGLVQTGKSKLLGLIQEASNFQQEKVCGSVCVSGRRCVLLTEQ